MTTPTTEPPRPAPPSERAPTNAPPDDAPLPPLAQPLVADDRVAASVRCLNCGYNLRTLPLNGHCPECDTPVRRALVRRPLRFAQAHTLRRLRGRVWTFASALILVAIPCVAWPVARLLAAASFFSLGEWSEVERLLEQVALYGLFAAPLGLLLSFFVVISLAALPLNYTDDQVARDLRLLRWLTGVAALLLVAGAAYWVGIGGFLRGPVGEPYETLPAPLLAGLALGLAWFGAARYLAAVGMTGLPQRPLATQLFWLEANLWPLGAALVTALLGRWLPAPLDLLCMALTAVVLLTTWLLTGALAVGLWRLGRSLTPLVAEARAREADG